MVWQKEEQSELEERVSRDAWKVICDEIDN